MVRITLKLVFLIISYLRKCLEIMAGSISLQGGSFRDALNRQNDPLAVCKFKIMIKPIYFDVEGNTFRNGSYTFSSLCLFLRLELMTYQRIIKIMVKT